MLSDYQVAAQGNPRLDEYMKVNQLLAQNDSSDKLERMQQQIQGMNLSDCKFEMLTSNRSWRSGIGKAPFVNNAALSGVGVHQVSSGIT